MARRIRRKPDPPMDSELPITPMLDMSFQLLAFFVITFNAPIKEGQLSILLPKEDPSANAVADPTVPPDEVLEYKVQVYSDHGDIGAISFVEEAKAAESIGGVDKVSALYAKLSSLTVPKVQRKIVIESMPDLKYGRLIELMDVCKRAGFDSVGIGQLKTKKTTAPAAPAGGEMPKQ
jgi:biopolymer transport protein ExbD